MRDIIMVISLTVAICFVLILVYYLKIYLKARIGNSDKGIWHLEVNDFMLNLDKTVQTSTIATNKTEVADFKTRDS